MDTVADTTQPIQSQPPSEPALPPLPERIAPPWRTLLVNVRIVRRAITPTLTASGRRWSTRFLVERAERRQMQSFDPMDRSERPWRMWLDQDEVGIGEGPDWDHDFLVTVGLYRKIREVLV